MWALSFSHTITPNKVSADQIMVSVASVQPLSFQMLHLVAPVQASCFCWGYTGVTDWNLVNELNTPTEDGSGDQKVQLFS